jgi:hypothetical protein
MTRYTFKVRTRNGLVVEAVNLQARDRAEADRRLLQMYHGCTILDCQTATPDGREEAASFESVISLISREPNAPPEPNAPNTPPEPPSRS